MTITSFVKKIFKGYSNENNCACMILTKPTNLIQAIYLLIFLLNGRCSNNTLKTGDMTYKNFPIVDVCDLPKYINKQVCIKCSYSGVDEYWSINSLKLNDCDSALLVDLDFKLEYKDLPKQYKKQLSDVHKVHPQRCLLITAIGIYETGQDGGYGHLGSNKSRFLVSEIISMKLIKNKD